MGIVLGSNFDVQTPLPLDSRMIVANSTARDAIATLQRYEGMKVYVTADKLNYQLVGGIANANWLPVGSNSLNGYLEDDSATGTDITLSTPKFIKRLTASISSICGITAPATNKLIILVNVSGGAIVIKNDVTATAANRILTGTGANLSFANGSSIWLVYDTTTTRWRVVGGSGSGGSNTVTSLGSLTGGSTISLNTSSAEQSFLVSGNTVAVTLSTTPFGSSPPQDGTKVYLIGNDDTKTVTIPQNTATNGCLMDGDITLAKGQVLSLMYLSTLGMYVRF